MLRCVARHHVLTRGTCRRFTVAPNKISVTTTGDDNTTSASPSGVVVGIWQNEELTQAGKEIDTRLNGALKQQLKAAAFEGKTGRVRLFTFPEADSTTPSQVAVVGLGNVGGNIDLKETLDSVDVRKELSRAASAGGTKALKKAGCHNIAVEAFEDIRSSSEGASLSTFTFDDLKKKKEDTSEPSSVNVSLFLNSSISEAEQLSSWKRGTTAAEAQNRARWLMEMPGNLMTPTILSDYAKKELGCLKNVVVDVHDASWAHDQGMGGFLSVGQGSNEASKFIEVRYTGGSSDNSEKKPLVLVGKGVCFDSGGISLKPGLNMDAMKADMGGAAVALSTLWAAATLQLPIDIVALIPAVENMPSGNALKPGDVVKVIDGTSIWVGNTDAEGRLIIADALLYAKRLNPKAIVDIATLTGAMVVALGGGATGVFSTSNSLWNTLEEAGYNAGDRVWRMPLFSTYDKRIQSNVADVANISTAGAGAGACTAAAFLRRFVNPDCPWAHMDMAGVMDNSDYAPYLTAKGMTGRPTRTLIEFVERVASGKVIL